MKKLGKKIYLESETVESYSCTCNCMCSCGYECDCSIYYPFYTTSDIMYDQYYGNRWNSRNTLSGVTAAGFQEPK